MKILIIGNGFDIAHNLPTTYNDFLDVCDGIINEFSSTPSTEKVFQEFCANTNKNEYTKLKQLVIFNSWINHFIERRNKLGRKWGDFESEIERVVNSIYSDMKSSSNEYFKQGPSYLALSRTVRNKNGNKRLTYLEVLSALSDELVDLIKALHMYFCYYVEKIPVEEISLFKNIRFDKILSFNYTTTYTDKYLSNTKTDLDYCYIHGRIDFNKIESNCNLVLGFDDHYLESGRAIIEIVPFEKYYQRIVKQTDNSYLRWISEIESNKEISEIYIFGHSLTLADGDILKKLINCQYIKTSIFCLDDSDRANKVANLAVILGPDNLIKLAGGINPSIEFIYTRK